MAANAENRWLPMGIWSIGTGIHHLQRGSILLFKQRAMRDRLVVVALAVSAMLFWGDPLASQPAPPVPPGFPDYVHLLDDVFNKHDITAYGCLFETNVKVYLDGVLIASDRSSYLLRIQSEFKRNLHVSTLSWAQGSQILTMQAVRGCIPENPDPHTVYHGCQWASATRYDLADDDKIASVHILKAEEAWNMHPSPD